LKAATALGLGVVVVVVVVALGFFLATVLDLVLQALVGDGAAVVDRGALGDARLLARLGEPLDRPGLRSRA